MPKRGAGTKYALKYVTVTQEEMRHRVIPAAVEHCAKRRAEEMLSALEYRGCLKETIRSIIRTGMLP